MKFSSLYFVGIFILLMTGCKPSPPQHDSQWDALLNTFISEQFRLRPTLAIAAGKHEFDGQIDDLSKIGLDSLVQSLRYFKTQVKDYDSMKLDSTQQFQRAYLLSEIDDQLFTLEKAKSPYKNPTYYFGTVSPDLYLTFEYAPLEKRMQSYTKYLRNLSRANRQIKANLTGSPLPKSFVDMGTLYFGGLSSYFKNEVPEVFASVKDSSMQTAFARANKDAIASVDSMNNWFAGMKTTAGDNYALGEDLYKQMLWDTERVNVPLEQLLAIGERDLQRNLDSLTAACRKLAPGKSVEECFKMVDAHKPADGPVNAAKAELSGLRQFLIDHRIVSIPGTEQCNVAEAPPHQRSNSAYIMIPGPYDAGVGSTYFIAPPLPEWTAAERNAYIPSVSTLTFTTVHEVWPGHFLQFLHANRAPTKFEQIFADYAFAEGWAHYAEEMMYNEGYGDFDPAMHIGQLHEALLRNVRFICSIKLHTQGMTVAEAEKMFREKAFQDPGNARQQAARGTYDPGYLNYTLGKLMIMKLRKDWMSEGGDSSSLKTFHDQFLSHGSPPIPLIRDFMLKKPEGAIL